MSATNRCGILCYHRVQMIKKDRGDPRRQTDIEHPRRHDTTFRIQAQHDERKDRRADDANQDDAAEDGYHPRYDAKQQRHRIECDAPSSERLDLLGGGDCVEIDKDARSQGTRGFFLGLGRSVHGDGLVGRRRCRHVLLLLSYC